MDQTTPLRLATHFGTLRDPRVRGRCDHRLLDLVLIALCATIANCNDWQQVAEFARARHEWFARFLPLPNGVPSHDTFERVFDRLDPKELSRCLRGWLRAVSDALGISHIAIDGKTPRGSGDAAAGLKPLHLVSAWATEANLSLGQVAVDEKSNEITAIPQLLKLLVLKGAFVSIDAMGCQKKIASDITTGGGNYVLAVKDNQSNLLDDVRDSLTKALEAGVGRGVETCETTDQGHGRRERRWYAISRDLSGIRGRSEWSGLSVIGMCMSERTVGGVSSEEVRYFIGSGGATVEGYARVLRNHWRIENNLHWQLDVTFGEDANRVSGRNGVENLSALRRLALSLLKNEGSKGSMACKRMRAALSPPFLENVLRAADKLGEV